MATARDGAALRALITEVRLALTRKASAQGGNALLACRRVIVGISDADEPQLASAR